jgi:hypothetical protein
MAKIRFRGFHAMLDAKVLAALLTSGSHALLQPPGLKTEVEPRAFSTFSSPELLEN